MNQVFRIRTFLVGQLFGTILDSTTLLFFIPVMLFFSPTMTAVVVGLGALIVVWPIAWLPAYRREQAQSRWWKRKGSPRRACWCRTVKSLALYVRQRPLLYVRVAQVTKSRFRRV